MSKLDLEAIRARMEAARPGPWYSKAMMVLRGDLVIATTAHEHNAEFISKSRTDIPALMAEVEALRGQRKQLQILVETLKDDALERMFEFNRDTKDLELRIRKALGEEE